MNHFIALNWFRYLISFLREKLCNRPGHYSITPKTLLLVSICCLGYQSQSKPHEWCLFASAAPADIRKATYLHISVTQFWWDPIHRNDLSALFTFSVPTVKPLMWYQKTRVHCGPVEEMTGVWRSVVWPYPPFELSAYIYHPLELLLSEEYQEYRIRSQIQLRIWDGNEDLNQL